MYFQKILCCDNFDIISRYCRFVNTFFENFENFSEKLILVNFQSKFNQKTDPH